MQTSARRPLPLGAVVFAALPIIFVIIRALQPGHDLRMLWMAIAALVGAAIVAAVGGMSKRRGGARVAVWLAAIVVGAALATIVGRMLGARALPGVAMVGLVLAGCWATSLAIRAIAASPER